MLLESVVELGGSVILLMNCAVFQNGFRKDFELVFALFHLLNVHFLNTLQELLGTLLLHQIKEIL